MDSVDTSGLRPSLCLAKLRTTELFTFSISVSPVDCVGQWNNGSCSVTCGTGVRIETFQITTAAVGTGKACEADNSSTLSIACEMDACGINMCVA